MRLSKLDSIVFFSAPVLMTYRFFVPGVSLAEALILVSLMAHGLKGSLWQVKILPWITVVFACLLLHMLLAGVFGSASYLGYFRLAKFFIIITFLAVVYEKTDRNILATVLVYIIALNIFGFLVQYTISFYSGVRFSLIVPFLPLVNSDLSIQSINLVLINDFRPGGLFMEPAHLGYFLFFSGLFLHRSNVGHKRILLPCICLTLFGTFSSFGFFAGLTLLFFCYGYMGTKKKGILLIASMFAVPFAASYLWELITVIPQVARLLDPESVAVTGRFSGGAEQVDFLKGASRVWGLGFGNFQLDGFVNGVNYLRLSFGSAGTVVIAIVFGVFSAINYRLFYYFTALFIISFFTALLFTPFVLIALSPLFVGNRNE